jgi:hypothetical protein
MRLRLFIRDGVGLDFEDLSHPGLDTLREFDRESLEMEIRETRIRDRMENENHEAERRDLEDGLKAYEEAVEEIAHVVKMQRMVDAARNARGPRLGRRSGFERRRSRARKRRVGAERENLTAKMMEE